MAISLQMLETSIRHQVHIEGLKAGEAEKFVKFLRRIDKAIRLELLTDDITEFSRARLERMIKSVRKTMGVILDEYQSTLLDDLLALAEYEAEFETKKLNDVLVEGVELSAPAYEQLRSAVFTAPLSVRGPDGGKLLEPFISDWAEKELDSVSGIIRQGYYEGQTTHQILRAIRGTKANQYKDGVLEVIDRHAKAITRTAVQHVATTAQYQTWKKTKLVIGYRWVSTLDGRTSAICRSLDDEVFKLGEGPLPPIHIGCRSTTVPELDPKYKFLKKGATRASQDGPVSGDENYYTWLRKQPINFQVSVLGKSRAELFRKGGLSEERFARLNLGRNFKPLTLDQMRKLEPLAFERANL